MLGCGGYGLMGFDAIIPLILFALIIYIVIKLASGNDRLQGNQHYELNEALNILNQKYAKGEISDEEYKKKKAFLKN